MLNHVSVGVRDVARAAEFYDAVLAPLGYKRVIDFLPTAIAYGDKAPSLWIQLPRGQQELVVGNGSHLSLVARSKDAIQAFYDAALAHGATDDGAPGPRPDYSPEYYAAFVIDPDGNRLEAVLIEAPKVEKPAKAKPAKKKAAAKAAKAAKPAKVAKPAKAAKPAKKAKPAKAAKPTKVAKPVKKAVKLAKKAAKPAKAVKPAKKAKPVKITKVAPKAGKKAGKKAKKK